MQTGIGRRRLLAAGLAIAATAFTALAGPAAQAQGYPNKPVRLILPFGAGGVGDTTARVAAEKLGEKLGQRFVVENMPGPGGMAAARAVLSNPADGYTLALITNGTAISVPLFKSLSFDPLKDFVPVSNLGTFDFIFATGPDSGFKTLGDFIKAAKASPGKLNVGTIAVGSSQNLSAELLKTTAGLDFQIVPYRNTPDLLVGAIRNDVQLMVDAYAAMKGPINDKKLIAVGTSGGTRSLATPDIPSVKEAGGGDFDVVSWNGIFVPAGTPADVIQTLNKAIHEVMADPAVKARLLDLGIEAKASTPEELSARLRGDIEKWGKVIERANIPKQ
jgi:tripartite-type tricarboxylate transporter receptor subunit TctC